MPVRMGIGLNTGECCVGNVGSPQRFDYSILGDVVNVASRLEEATKAYALPIVAGERTALAAPELAFLELSSVAIRGKERAVRLFALLGDETMAASAKFKRLKQVWARLKAALDAGDARAAAAALGECQALRFPELAAFLEGEARRLKS
jgi:adenylate cyclase